VGHAIDVDAFENHPTLIGRAPIVDLISCQVATETRHLRPVVVAHHDFTLLANSRVDRRIDRCDRAETMLRLLQRQIPRRVHPSAVDLERLAKSGVCRPVDTTAQPSYQEGVLKMGNKSRSKHGKKRESTRVVDVPDAAAAPEPGAKMKRKDYEAELEVLQGELVAMQEWVRATGAKICIVFEGRDTAGKGGTIKRITERVSPRTFRVVALPAPTEREKSQMYIQRYIKHFPAAGEVVIFDRSWYNRAGVEPVMEFCTPEQAQRFLDQAPAVEKAMVESGILLIKYWLEVSADEQTKRLTSRIDDPRKIWKLSDMDLKSYSRWYDYSRARDAMLAATDTSWAPWFIAHTDDKKRGRLNIISHLLSHVPYEKIERPEIKLPKRQPARGYVELDLPLRHIPEPY
jgi:polyphosphate kinase 2